MTAPDAALDRLDDLLLELLEAQPENDRDTDADADAEGEQP